MTSGEDARRLAWGYTYHKIDPRGYTYHKIYARSYTYRKIVFRRDGTMTNMRHLALPPSESASTRADSLVALRTTR